MIDVYRYVQYKWFFALHPASIGTVSLFAGERPPSLSTSTSISAVDNRILGGVWIGVFGVLPGMVL